MHIFNFYEYNLRAIDAQMPNIPRTFTDEHVWQSSNHHIQSYVMVSLFSGGSRISQRGSVDLVGGRGLPRQLCFKILYVKTKESGPLGGRAPDTPPLAPPMLVSYDKP